LRARGRKFARHRHRRRHSRHRAAHHGRSLQFSPWRRSEEKSEHNLA
jgi:hypothetical protein